MASVEERLEQWMQQPGAFVTDAERRFIELMRDAAAEGVGYGWMQQVIEWEWQDKGLGAFGPAYFDKERRELRAIIARKDEALRPFAEAAANFDIPQIKNPDEWTVWRETTGGEVTKAITVTDLRRAADEHGEE